jgi:hypothetical protein
LSRTQEIIYSCTVNGFLESSTMLFLMISKHSPESCPFNNEKVKKLNVAAMAKSDQINKKYGIKTVGEWVSMPEHLMVAVYDAPSLEALMKVSREPELMSVLMYSTTEIHPVMTLEEGMKSLK